MHSNRPTARTAYAPGRVNLLGDHTDYTGGLVLPMAVDRGTTVVFSTDVGGSRGGVLLRSGDDPEPAAVALDVDDPRRVEPRWARLVAAVIVELRAAGHDVAGGEGSVTTSLPLGAGLSSSAALEVSVALALGATGSHLEIAQLCRRAEELASGVRCGIMDQLASVAGVEGCALLIDCTRLTVDPVPVPDGVDVLVIDSGEHRTLSSTPYAARRAECERAAELVGPLREARCADVERIAEPLIRRRARHVVTENARVMAAADAMRSGDVVLLGQLMTESHASLRDDFDVSTPALEAVVDHLHGTPGVLGARLTGAGFGGCVVALVTPGTRVEGWRVRASCGAQVTVIR